MGTSLFIDTTNGQTIGLFKDAKWLVFKRDEKAKSSEELHFVINQLVSNLQLKLQDLETVYTCSGPGSYTGMRVGEGLAQILEWQKIKVQRFHLHRLPQVFGITSGAWISRAFKGEYFIFEWSERDCSKKLVKKNNLPSRINDFWSPQDDDMTQETLNIYDEIYHSFPRNTELIFKEFQRAPLFYYRELDQEFRKEG